MDDTLEVKCWIGQCVNEVSFDGVCRAGLFMRKLGTDTTKQRLREMMLDNFSPVMMMRAYVMIRSIYNLRIDSERTFFSRDRCLSTSGGQTLEI